MYRLMLLLAGIAAMPCSAEFRDPTQPVYLVPPATTATVDNTELVLSAIWMSTHSRRATINGISAKQGQTLNFEKKSTLKPDQATPENTFQHPTPTPLELLKSAQLPVHPNTIKVISIHKNSVIIDQNGKLKTLQLVHRSYK